MAKTTEDRLADRVQEAVDVASHPQHVPVNMYETDESFVVIASLPGVMPDDIRVTVFPDALQIEADMRTPAIKDYLIHEWHYGPFERVVDLPGDCGADAQASFGNGQLAVRLPKGQRTDGPVVISIGP